MASNKIETLRKLRAHQSNPDVFNAPNTTELVDLVILVLSQVNVIEKAIEEGRLDGETPESDKHYMSKESAVKMLTEAINEQLQYIRSEVEVIKGDTSNAVQEALENIRNGEDGIVTEDEIERAASMALSMLELPDFDALISEKITTDSEAIRDALELLQGEARYSVEIADVKGLEESLRQLNQIRSTNGGTIGKQQVYSFIRQAITDGTISTGGSVDDTVYGASWDGDTTTAPSKNAVYDKIEALSLGAGTGDVVGPISAVNNNLAVFDGTTGKLIKDGGVAVAGLATAAQGALADTAAQPGDLHSAVTVTDSAEIDFTLTGQDITASLKAGSIDETKLDISTNASLDLADSAIQPGDTIDADVTPLTNIEVADIKATALIDSIEGLNGNANDTSLPTSQAVVDYVGNTINFIHDFFFNDTLDAVGGIYYQMTNTDLANPASSLVSGTLTTGNNQALFNFINDTGLGVSKLNTGIYQLHMHALKTGTKSVSLYAEVYTRTSIGTETLIGTTASSPVLALTDIDFTLEVLINETAINTTDKIVVKWYANVGASGSDVTVTLNLENGYNSRVGVPITTDILSQIYLQKIGGTMSGDILMGGNNIDNLGDVTFKTGATGGTVRTGTSNADKFELQAYDVDGAAYQKVLEVDAGNIPTLEVFDNSFQVRNFTDETKILDIDVSGVTTGTARTLTMADTDIDLANVPTVGEKTVLGNTSGTNTGDVTLAGTPNYITIAGQVITRALINLTSHVTGILPIANGGTGASTASGALTNLGLTATAAELNTLDGITATVTELNYTAGVTSAIQTQLDAAKKKRFAVRLVDSATDVATGTTIGGDYRIYDGAITVTGVGAYVDTAGTTGVTTIDINEGGITILSTKVTIDSAEKTSETAATAPVISDSAIAADGIITIDVDGISTTAPKGLVVWVDYTIN